ncbi:hypothetical protein [Microbulbifer sp.]|uniref:Vgb family protein n=1 Tax=Microbulbifer sp. TaxID=1908541 RepID=UPI00258B2147|nr:hypothetical protein [Microbulbifer sp.]
MDISCRRGSIVCFYAILIGLLLTFSSTGSYAARDWQSFHTGWLPVSPAADTIKGTVKSHQFPLVGYRISLYANFTIAGGFQRKLATAVSEEDGSFSLHFRLPPGLLETMPPVLLVVAEKGEVTLATVVAGNDVPSKLVVNERTTVAMATAFAQFIHGKKLRGNHVGMQNAVKMAANMAVPSTGLVSPVLLQKPNGNETSTLPTFNALSNVVAACVATQQHCEQLFVATTQVGEAPVDNVLQAIANAARYPSYPYYPQDSADPLFLLSLAAPVYQPALPQRPTSWLLFIKFTGGNYSAQDQFNLINGPGNIAFDAEGSAWILNNYVPKATNENACASQRLLRFQPWGETYPGSPYYGGGLSGAGFGITLDPRGRIWVGNFGFESPACADGTVPPDPDNKIPATHNSVSLFHKSGRPISREQGFTRGNIWWPQGTVSDRRGNIWVANCGNDTVTMIPGGNPLLAKNFPLPGSNPDLQPTESPSLKPFAIAIDRRGRAWITGNKSERLYRIDRRGRVEEVDITGVELSWPMGISSDSKGNMWVSNSDAVNVPCVDPLDTQGGGNPSMVFIPADGSAPVQVFGQGGLSIPWGNAVDGSDTIWVFNFGHTPFEDAQEDTVWPDTGVSRFCGSGECPQGMSVGDAISPDTGYTSDALERITGGGIDPSGNLWLLNNWKKIGPFVYDTNPGSNSFVIVPGAATPVKTPLIGVPRHFR